MKLYLKSGYLTFFKLHEFPPLDKRLPVRIQCKCSL